MWKNVAQQEETDDNMVHVHFTLGNQGYKHTLSEYIILTAFPTQQWLYKRPSTLLYVHCPSCFKIVGDVLLQRWNSEKFCVAEEFLLPDK
jgi:hypothetical protein